MSINRDDKYVTFKRGDLADSLGRLNADELLRLGLGRIEVRDAVVIRRQDLFASPALATYAACIAITAACTDNDITKKSLTDVADYFQRQAELAAAEGYKLPDV